MSYTIVNDDGTLEIRASIRTIEDLSEFIEKLNRIFQEATSDPTTVEMRS